MQNAFEAKHEDWHEEGEIVENRSNRSSVRNAEETSKVAHVVIIFFICRHCVTPVRAPLCPQNFLPSVCLSVCGHDFSSLQFVFLQLILILPWSISWSNSSRKFSTKLQRRNTSKQTLKYSRKDIVVVVSTLLHPLPFSFQRSGRRIRVYDVARRFFFIVSIYLPVVHWGQLQQKSVK